MALPFVDVGESVIFGLSVRHIRFFVGTDLVTMISHEWLEQSR